MSGRGALARLARLPYAAAMTNRLRCCLLVLLAVWTSLPAAAISVATTPKKVYLLPIRDDIMPPLVYLVRRGVKEAMAANADVLILDMKTNGGRVDVTEEIIKILDQFKGETVTYVNDRAFSAGAFISAATQKIYMAPQSVIGAAAPIMLSPGGGGVQDLPNTYEVKMNSAVRALVRTSAEKNGHNVEVLEAMIDKNRSLTLDGHVLKEKGDILTLTNGEAEKEYGTPPKPLLSLGTVENLDALLVKLGYAGVKPVTIEPTGAETVASWINRISVVLLIVGIVGLYIEFKTPGFGLPGIVGIAAFVIYFFGGYIAGLSGLEWLAVFVLGIALVALELFLFPGTLLPGIAGAALILVALVMAMVDTYPGMPALPTLPQLTLPLRQLALAVVVALAAAYGLSRWLPRTSFYNALVLQSPRGEIAEAAQAQAQQKQIGRVGVTVSVLRPGGKAQFGDELLDVLSPGELIEKGVPVRIVSHSGAAAIVEPVA